MFSVTHFHILLMVLLIPVNRFEMPVNVLTLFCIWFRAVPVNLVIAFLGICEVYLFFKFKVPVNVLMCFFGIVFRVGTKRVY